MGLILSIETSTPICSIALHRDGKLVDSESIELAGAHAERLMGMIEDLLERSHTKASLLDAVAVSEGPGSYTGLRIGVSTAKGLAFAWDIPLIGISTMKVLAFAAQKVIFDQAYIVALLDARRMEVFDEVFDQDLNSIVSLESKLINEDSFIQLLEERKVYFVGDGADKASHVIQHRNAVFLDLKIDAAYMGEIASEKFMIGEFADLAYFVPNYLKEFKALHSKKNPLLL
jgi:tRNA threonylcarbamoyladenosine biosynthesis protein TsaB